MGEEMVPIAKLTAWDPPVHFATEGDNAFGPGSPKIGYEWTVEAKDGGGGMQKTKVPVSNEHDGVSS